MTETPAIIKWQDPPPKASSRAGKRHTVLDRIADELKANPGRWALVKEKASPGFVEPLKERGLQVAMRGMTGSNYGDIYARYNPGESK